MFRTLWSRRRRPQSPLARSRHSRRPLAVEGLEDRTLLSYTFTPIDDTTAHIASFPNLPSINCDGTMAYTADIRSGGRGVFTSDGRIIAITSDLISNLATSPPINCAGTVVFRADLRAGGSAIFAGNGGPLTRIADTSNVFREIRGVPAINDEGLVAFRASPTSGGEGFFLSAGGLPAMLYVTGGQFEGFPIVPGELIGLTPLNNARQIAFRASLTEGGEGIFVGDGGPVTTIADTSDGTFAEFTHLPNLNDLGQAFFRANLSKGGQAMVLGDGKVLTVIVDTDGPYSSFVVRSSLNNAGEVVFHATLDRGGSGLFTGPDPVADKVLSVGDPLLGSTVTVVGCFAHCLNDDGQIAIRATLADGRQVLIRAEPDRAAPGSGRMFLDLNALSPWLVTPAPVPAVTVWSEEWLPTSDVTAERWVVESTILAAADFGYSATAARSSSGRLDVLFAQLRNDLGQVW